MEGTSLSRHVGTRADVGAAQIFSPIKFVCIIKYKPMTCKFPILIFNFLIFLCLLYVTNPRVHLQEGSCIYSYGMVHFTCISISSLVGRRVYSVLYN
jgi:hypothetical protein